jgi:hypothetical protein
MFVIKRRPVPMTREEMSLLRSPEADIEDAQWIRVMALPSEKRFHGIS